MRDFKKSGSFGRQSGGNIGGGNFDRRESRRPSSGGRGGFDGGHRDLFDATCANCGKPCQVPFRPSGDRPVYCRDCFARQAGSSGGSGNIPKKNFESRPPFRTHAPQGIADQRIDEIKRTLDAVNSKIDQLLRAAAPAAPVTPSVKSIVVKTVKIDEEKKEKSLKPLKKKTLAKKR